MTKPVRNAIEKTIIKYFVTYLCIAAVVILTLIPVYTSAYRSSYDNMVEKLRQQIQVRLDNFDQALYSCSIYMADVLNRDETIRIAHTYDIHHSHIDLALQLKKDMSSRLTSQTMLFDEVILLFENSNVVILMNSVSDRNKYYGSKCLFDDISKERFEEQVFNGQFISTREIKTESKNKTGRGIAISYRGNAVIKPYVAGCVVIYEDSIRNLLLEETIRDFGAMEVYDAQGNIYYSYNDHEINDERVTKFSLNGAKNMVSVNIKVDNKAFDINVRPVKRMVLGLCGLAMMTVVILTSVFVFRTMIPFRRCVAELPEEIVNENLDYRNIGTLFESSVINFKSAKTYLESVINELKNRNRSMIVTNLVNGLKVSDEEIRKEFGDDYVGYSNFVVALPYCISSTGKIKQADWELLQDEILSSFDKTYVQPYNSAFIIIGTDSCAVVCDELETIIHRSAEKIDDNIRIIVSNLHSGKNELFDAYNETLKCQHMLSESSTDYGVIITCTHEYGMLQLEEMVYTFKPSKYYELLMSGDEKSTKEYLRELSERYAGICTVFPQRLIALYYNIVEVLEATLANQHIEYYINEYNARQDYDTTFTYLTETTLIVQKMLSNNRSSEKSASIIAYIDENCCNPDMCLSLVADAFSLSEARVSRLIKIETGCMYSEYLEAKRMKIASELLRNSKKTVKEICEAVGYINQNTFFKAFKRYYHMSPGNYKKMMGDVN